MIVHADQHKQRKGPRGKITFNRSISTYTEAVMLFAEMRQDSDIQKLLADNSKTMDGGYVCIASADGLPLLVSMLGSCPQEKRAGRLKFCQEKVARLATHPDHHLSRESANEELEQYPGAVRVRRRTPVEEERLISFSGAPGHLDELYSLALPVRLSWMAPGVARSILQIHTNDYAMPSIINRYF